MMDTGEGLNAVPPVAVEQEVTLAPSLGMSSPTPSDDTTQSEGVESDSLQIAVGVSEHAYSSASKPSLSEIVLQHISCGSSL